MLEALKLEEISVEDKFMMMEELWDSMKQHKNEDYFTPQWHIDILENRKKRVDRNESDFSDISEVKKRLEQR